LQDWCDLLTRPTGAPPLPADVTAAPAAAQAPAAPAGPICNICGGTDFAAGPNGRMAGSGMAPRCVQCGALERHRILRRVFQGLPLGWLDWRRGLQFSTDHGIDPGWFKHYEVSVFGGTNSLDMQEIARPDGSYDFISLNHVLESVPNDRAAFDELCRVLSPAGIIQVCFGGTESRERTIDLERPMFDWAAHHLYGRDVRERFGCAEKGLTVLVVEESDPCTGMREIVHLFMKRAEDAQRVKAWLTSWSPTLRLLP
jgi:hypothetical protein